MKSDMDEALDQYISLHTSAAPDNLERLERDVNVRLLYPRMCSGHVQGRLLKMLTAMIRPQRVLEIGTYAGYSALCIAEALPEGATLDTVEIDDEMEDFIRSAFAASPYGSRIRLHIGDIAQVSDLNPPYDLIYMDANKRTYLETFSRVRFLLRPGGFVIADNTLWDGKVTDTEKNHDAQTLGIARFNDAVAQDPTLEVVMLPLRDGLTLIRVKEPAGEGATKADVNAKGDADVPKRGAVAVVGMFDGVHLGHRFLLSQLRDEAERMSAISGEKIVPLVVTFPDHPLRVIAPGKEPLLLTDPAQKLLHLEAEEVDVRMIEFDEALRHTSARDFLLMLRNRFGVRTMMMGYNNRFGHDAPRDFESYRAIAAECGVELIVSSEYRYEGATKVSSSEIRTMLAQGDVAEANRLLGRPYAIEGVVSHGREIGRTIGFPTANLVPACARQLIPMGGVYAGEAMLADGSTFPAVINIGTNPTVSARTGVTGATACATVSAPDAATDSSAADASANGKGPNLSIEAHLIGFSGDIYGSQLTLRFLRRLRGEQCFPSLNALRDQISRDVASAT